MTLQKVNLHKVNLEEKFGQFSDHWNPRVVGEFAGQQVKVVKFQGTFDWHHHEHEDELFWVVRGAFFMDLRDPDERQIRLEAGEFLVVPHGTVHRPRAEEEVWVALIEPTGTLNTGNVQSERTRDPHALERL